MTTRNLPNLTHVNGLHVLKIDECNHKVCITPPESLCIYFWKTGFLQVNIGQQQFSSTCHILLSHSLKRHKKTQNWADTVGSTMHNVSGSCRALKIQITHGLQTYCAKLSNLLFTSHSEPYTTQWQFPSLIQHALLCYMHRCRIATEKCGRCNKCIWYDLTTGNRDFTMDSWHPLTGLIIR
jgi:hypothetical protein